MPEPAGRPVISIDRDLCMGSGMCVVYAPGTFAHDDETKAVVVDPPGDPIDSVRIAVEACPTGALRLVTDEHEHEHGHGQECERHMLLEGQVSDHHRRGVGRGPCLRPPLRRGGGRRSLCADIDPDWAKETVR